MSASVRSQLEQVMTSVPTPVAGFVYVIGACTPSGFKTYVGWTLDPDRRLEQHNNGSGAKSTRGQRWQLLYVEKLETRAAAMSREWHLKRDRRFRRQLAGLWPSLPAGRVEFSAERQAPEQRDSCEHGSAHGQAHGVRSATRRGDCPRLEQRSGNRKDHASKTPAER